MENGRDPPRPSAPQFRGTQNCIAPVAREHFVSAIALQDDLDRSLEFPRKQIQGNVGGIRERLVAHPDQFRHDVFQGIAADAQLVMIEAQQPGDTAGLGQLVHSPVVVESDRKAGQAAPAGQRRRRRDAR